MGYVVVVFTIINSAALVGFALLLLYVVRDLPLWVGTGVQDEIRKQDDRIEKRLAKREGAAGSGEEELATRRPDGMVAGAPFRR